MILGEKADSESLRLASDLRGAGIRTDRAFGGGSMKSQMRRADRSGARFVLVLGDDELAKGVVAVRDMAESRQEDVSRDAIGRFLISRLRP
ncbi:His/Gly/Thr/Pro-type tRNA ligase C-terminal domain-containing protein [Nitrospinota bacterium]